MSARALAAIAVLLALTGAAAADEADPVKPSPPFRFSIGAGTALLITGQGDAGRNRLDGHLDIMPGGRFGRWGLITALRHVVIDPIADDALITVGVRYEGAAARPRLALALHADVGATISPGAPAIGGGVETHLWVWPKKLGPLAVVFDLTAHLIIDGTDSTRLVIASATRLSISR